MSIRRSYDPEALRTTSVNRIIEKPGLFRRWRVVEESNDAYILDLFDRYVRTTTGKVRLLYRLNFTTADDLRRELREPGPYEATLKDLFIEIRRRKEALRQMESGENTGGDS